MTSTAEFGDVRQRRRRSRSVDPDVLKFIQRHATETDAGAMAIYRAAEVQYGESRLPSERTVRSIVAAERPEDTSGLWSVGTGIEEPRVTIPCLYKSADCKGDANAVAAGHPRG